MFFLFSSLVASFDCNATYFVTEGNYNFRDYQVRIGQGEYFCFVMTTSYSSYTSNYHLLAFNVNMDTSTPYGLKVGFTSLRSSYSYPSLYNLSSSMSGITQFTYTSSGSSERTFVLTSSHYVNQTVKLAMVAVPVNINERVYVSDTPNDCISFANDYSANYHMYDYSSYYFTYINFNRANSTKTKVVVRHDSYYSTATVKVYYDEYTPRTTSTDMTFDSTPIVVLAKDIYTDITRFSVNVGNVDSVPAYHNYYLATSWSTYSAYKIESSSKHTCYTDYDYDTTIGALLVAIIVYFSIVMVLLVLNIIMACMHPNRLYRGGITCACCYCCCTDSYYHSNTYYASHHYHSPCICFCGDCNCNNLGGGGGDGKGVAILFLIIFLLILIFIAFLLAYNLYVLCVAADEEERNFESSTIHNKGGSNTTVVVVNNQPLNQPLQPGPQYPQQPMMGQPQQPMMQPQQPMMQPQQPMMMQPQQSMMMQPQQPMMQPQQPMMQPQQPMMMPQQSQNPYYDNLNPYANMQSPYSDQKPGF